MDKKIVIALAIAGILLIPGLFVLTENVEADVFNYSSATVNSKPNAWQSTTNTYVKTYVKIYKQISQPNGVFVVVVAENLKGTWLGPLSCQISYATAGIGTQGDNSPSRVVNDLHFANTYYSYLPRNGQNYQGYGHVGTSGTFVDVDTGPQSNTYSTNVGSNYVRFQIANGGWQMTWNGLTQAAFSTSYPSSYIVANGNYQTADWCVFWWNVHSVEYFNMPIYATYYV